MSALLDEHPPDLLGLDVSAGVTVEQGEHPSQLPLRPRHPVGGQRHHVLLEIDVAAAVRVDHVVDGLEEGNMKRAIQEEEEQEKEEEEEEKKILRSRAAPPSGRQPKIK